MAFVQSAEKIVLFCKYIVAIRPVGRSVTIGAYLSNRSIRHDRCLFVQSVDPSRMVRLVNGREALLSVREASKDLSIGAIRPIGRSVTIGAYLSNQSIRHDRCYSSNRSIRHDRCYSSDRSIRHGW